MPPFRIISTQISWDEDVSRVDFERPLEVWKGDSFPDFSDATEALKTHNELLANQAGSVLTSRVCAIEEWVEKPRLHRFLNESVPRIINDGDWQRVSGLRAENPKGRLRYWLFKQRADHR